MQTIREIPFVAGNPALDFVNTAEERGHPESGDALVRTSDLRLWGQRYGLISAAAKLEGSELPRALEARELLYAVFHGRAHQRPIPRSALARLAELAAEAYRAAELRTHADGTVRWHWSRSDLATVRHVVVTSAVELLHAEPSPRLKQCPGDHCGWFFLDTTKRGNRRWCQMAECGQEAKDAGRRRRRASAR